ncbi:hypothetical protein EI94DRAFT_938404 [Lactarius quietus]|nr:hypothetical protein EI94DRAFT_938404 [Lactarius quietus]
MLCISLVEVCTSLWGVPTPRLVVLPSINPSAWRIPLVAFLLIPFIDTFHVPVQALMIRRCYHLAGKSLSIVTPLVLLWVATVVTTLWSIVLVIRFVTSMKAKSTSPSIESTGISWLYLISIRLPSVLDLSLTGICALSVLTVILFLRTYHRIYRANLKCFTISRGQ